MARAIYTTGEGGGVLWLAGRGWPPELTKVGGGQTVTLASFGPSPPPWLSAHGLIEQGFGWKIVCLFLIDSQWLARHFDFDSHMGKIELQTAMRTRINYALQSYIVPWTFQWHRPMISPGMPLLTSSSVKLVNLLFIIFFIVFNNISTSVWNEGV